MEKPGGSRASIFDLQRKVGNQAFGNLVQGPALQRKCDCGGTCSKCQEEELQRKAAGGETSGDGTVPEIVHEVLRAPGQPLDQGTQAMLGNRFGRDLSGVRVHTDERAAESADSINALAYTVGRDMVFAKGQFAPNSPAGQKLLAHELTHVAQQDGVTGRTNLKIADDPVLESDARSAESGGHKHAPQKKADGGKVQRTPAAPEYKGSTATYDRAQVKIDPVSDVMMTGGAVPPQSIGVTISAAGATLLEWILYNPDDEFVQGGATLPKLPDSLTRPFKIDSDTLKYKLKQGRYILRAVARGHNGTPIAYADQSFFVWTTTPLAGMNRAGLAGIMGSSATHSLGELGAAKARDMMLEHQETLAATGTGTIMGNQCTVPAPGGVAKSDCTQFVYDILKYAFGAKGSAAVWADVAKEASRLSGSGGLRGTALQKALETKAGWKGVFWAPSPRNPEDASSEHPVAYKRVREKGLYSKDDVTVDSSHSVIDFRPTSTTKEPVMTAIDQLKKVPLGVISARGGTHMTLLINGQVYEVHWTKPPTDPDVIQATPLERWEWQSGVIVMPDESFTAAFGP